MFGGSELCDSHLCLSHITLRSVGLELRHLLSLSCRQQWARAARDLGSSGAGIQEAEHHEDILKHAFPCRSDQSSPDLRRFCFGDWPSLSANARVLWSRWVEFCLCLRLESSAEQRFAPHPILVTWAGVRKGRERDMEEDEEEEEGEPVGKQGVDLIGASVIWPETESSRGVSHAKSRKSRNPNNPAGFCLRWSRTLPLPSRLLIRARQISPGVGKVSSHPILLGQ